MRQKVAASTFARGYLTGIIGTVFDQLTASGHFYDPILAEVEGGFMPWLKEQACNYLMQGVITRQVRLQHPLVLCIVPLCHAFESVCFIDQGP